MNNDLISRSALKEEFLKCKPYAVDFLSLICNAPTVSAITKEKLSDAYDQGYEDGKNNWLQEERPHGEWVSKHLWDNTHVWVCSECGNRNTHGITVEKACWRCGADMRKGGAE